MEMTRLSNSIIEFLLLSSALVFILGVLSSLVLRILKIQGKPKLWIYALLVIMPLAYPIQGLFPDPIKISIPLKTLQLFDFHLFETTAGEKAASNDVSFLTTNTASTYQTEDKETTYIGHETLSSNSTIRPMETESRFPVDWKLMATLAWVLVFLYFLARLVTMVYNTRRFSRLPDPVTNPQVLKLLRQCTVDTGLCRTPRLLTLDRLPAPMVMGFFNPRILLPRHLLKPEFREGLRFTLLHELKHVHQHHNWWLLIESIVGAAYFFHPVILWAKKGIHEELEYICDSHVVHITNKSISYADFLLHEIWQQKRERNLVLALPFISGMAKTTNRVRYILENARPTLFAQIRGNIALCLIFLSFISLLLCNVAPSAQDPEQTPHKITLALTDNQDNASFQAQTPELEREAPTLLKREEMLPERNSLFGLSVEQPSLDDSAVFLQTAASSVRADAHKDDARTTLQEEPRYKPVLERKSPTILIDEARTQAEEIPEKQPISDSIPSVHKPVFDIDAVDIIVLAQNESSMTSASDAAAVSETKAIEMNHENASFYIHQGTANYRQGRFDKAISDYSKAIEINPRFAVTYNNRGSAYYQQGQIDKAISDYSRAIEINPRFAVTYNNRGSAYCQQGQIDKAISDYNKAIEINPGFAVAYANRGSAYYQRIRYVSAIFDFSKAIALDPVNANTYYTRGSTYYRIGQIDKAIPDFNKAIELDPEYITKMPKGVTLVRNQGDIDYSSYVAESLKWHHGSLPLHYWDMARMQNANCRITKPYQIKKRSI
jgi:Flp pilus assembly protein TadD/beta-lactamase regulating signal transducer with metallopeptidase domain